MSNENNNNNNNLKRKRSVTFQDSNRYSYDDHLSDEERKSLWYGLRDIAAFRSQTKAMIQELFQRQRQQQEKEGNSNTVAAAAQKEEEEICLRGLEKFTTTNDLVEMQEVRNTFIAAILEIQREQKTNVSGDPRGLLVLASACSRNAHKRARKLAAEDEAEAVQCYMSSSSTQTTTTTNLTELPITSSTLATRKATNMTWSSRKILKSSSTSTPQSPSSSSCTVQRRIS